MSRHVATLTGEVIPKLNGDLVSALDIPLVYPGVPFEVYALKCDARVHVEYPDNEDDMISLYVSWLTKAVSGEDASFVPSITRTSHIRYACAVVRGEEGEIIRIMDTGEEYSCGALKH